MMRAEFLQKPFHSAGEFIIANEPQQQSEPMPRWTPPPPPWSEHYTGDEPELEVDLGPEAEDEPKERGSEE